MDALFLTGIALHLAALDLGVWRPDGIYQPDDTGIVLVRVPEEPASVIVLGSYAVSDDPDYADSVLGLQVQVRAAGENPTPMLDLTSSVFAALHGIGPLNLPTADPEATGPRVLSCERRSHTSGGQDRAGRWSSIQNFYTHVHYPTAHRL